MLGAKHNGQFRPQRLGGDGVCGEWVCGEWVRGEWGVRGGLRPPAPVLHPSWMLPSSR